MPDDKITETQSGSLPQSEDAAGSGDEAQENPPEPAAAQTAAARREIARAEVCFGPRIGGQKRSRFGVGGCYLIMLLLSGSLLGGVWYLCCCYQPKPVEYAPIPLAGEDRTRHLGMELALMLPEGWSEERGNRFSGPGGATLVVTHGTQDSLGMHPRTYDKQVVRSEYTESAYAASLLARRRDTTEIVYARRVVLGRLRGVETALRLRRGVMRAFVFLYGKSGENAVELCFTLPGGEGSPSWRDAAVIARTLCFDAPPVPVRDATKTETDG